MSFHDWTLDNGLRVVGERHPQMRSVSLGFFVKTGSRDEPPELQGISHFLEHMLFKGSRKRSGKHIDEVFDRLGAEYNAFTGHEYTGYYARVLPEHLVTVFELLADMMHPALREEDFETERQVILEEIALYEDRPASVARRRALEIFYDGHPLGRDILGTAASIRALEVEAMRAYHARRYGPSQLVLAAVGRFAPEALLDLARRHCGAWQGSPSGRDYPPFTPRQAHRALRRPHVARAHLVLLSPAPAYQDPRREAMDLLVDVWGHPGNSRLHWALVDKGLVDYATAGYQPQDRAGMTSVSVGCDPAALGEVQARLEEEIEHLVAHGPTPEELDSARNRVLTSLAVEGEQSLRRLFSFAFDFLYDQPYQSLEEVLDAYQRVTLEEIRALLRDFPFAPRTVVTLEPAEG